eukprot:c24706_g1_i1 orf=194-532(-)
MAKVVSKSVYTHVCCHFGTRLELVTDKTCCETFRVSSTSNPRKISRCIVLHQEYLYTCTQCTLKKALQEIRYPVLHLECSQSMRFCSDGPIRKAALKWCPVDYLCPCPCQYP